MSSLSPHYLVSGCLKLYINEERVFLQYISKYFWTFTVSVRIKGYKDRKHNICLKITYIAFKETNETQMGESGSDKIV